MRRDSAPRRWCCFRVLVLMTAVIAVGHGNYSLATNSAILREMCIATAKYHAARADYYRSSIPKAQTDLDEALRRQRDEAAALAT